MPLPLTISFKGKVAIVTEASRGLGKDTILEPARRGADVPIKSTAYTLFWSRKVPNGARELGSRADLSGVDMWAWIAVQKS